MSGKVSFLSLRLGRGAVLAGLLWCVLSIAATPPLHAEVLRSGGPGSIGPIIALLFEEFRRQHPEARLDHALPPLGSSGALKALAAGRIDLAVVGRPLKPDEVAQFGNPMRFAATPLLFASGSGVGARDFKLADLAAIYDGRRRRWEDGAPLRLLLRPAFDTETQLLASLSPTMAAALDEAARRPGMVTAFDDLDALDLLNQTPGSLGPVTLGLLATRGSGLTRHSLEGVVPSLAALEAGQYRLRREFLLVVPRQGTALAKRFAEFLRSESARAILRRHDYLPLQP